ncbi:class I SAM-dependent methyltransferase [bacterium]|nr:class I SAM-dependent methyltransferase [bacterium]
MSINHLPYTIDPKKNRFHFYETLWKVKALDLLKKEVGDLSGLSLFDYGCGRGETLELSSEMGLQSEGWDVDPECVKISKELGDAKVMELVDGRAVLPEERWDVVTCFHVLEHVEAPKLVLQDLARAAKKYVLVAVPNLQKVPNFRKPKSVFYGVNEGHLQSWDHATFLNLAENHCGLKLVGWAHDATVLPVFSEIISRVFGTKSVIKLETGLFRKMFPFWGHSIIGLFEKK